MMRLDEYSVLRTQLRWPADASLLIFKADEGPSSAAGGLRMTT
jgi:hypothetical protein